MSFKFINGIAPKVVKNDFDSALDNLLENIHLDFVKWANGRNMEEDKLSVKPGRKFIKIIRDNSVWGFVAKKGGVHKGIPFKTGDVFKAASWSSPAKHVRGSIFDTNTDWFAWTGPNYL